MKNKSITGARHFLMIVMTLAATIRLSGQTPVPDELYKNTLNDQLKYLQDKTRIYENYRAIREDMFQVIKKNAIDSLSASKIKVAGLSSLRNRLNKTIDSLNVALDSTKIQLNEMTTSKNSIRLLGIEVNKITYNSIMWILVAGLIALLVMGFLAFKRNVLVTSNTRNELKDLKDEFEAYRKSSREAREKMSMEHFNELKKLRGG